jgi:hypothetical protein
MSELSQQILAQESADRLRYETRIRLSRDVRAPVDGLKRKWGRKHKHFESFDDILVDYLNSLPSDDARRESVTEVLNQRRRQRGKDSPAQP